MKNPNTLPACIIGACLLVGLLAPHCFTASTLEVDAKITNTSDTQVISHGSNILLVKDDRLYRLKPERGYVGPWQDVASLSNPDRRIKLAPREPLTPVDPATVPLKSD